MMLRRLRLCTPSPSPSPSPCLNWNRINDDLTPPFGFGPTNSTTVPMERRESELWENRWRNDVVRYLSTTTSPVDFRSQKTMMCASCCNVFWILFSGSLFVVCIVRGLLLWCAGWCTTTPHHAKQQTDLWVVCWL